jgi:hypothetical protein
MPAPFGPVALQPGGEPGWFRVGVPAGWRVLADRASGRIALSAPDGRGLQLRLLLLPREAGPRDAAALLNLLSAQVAPRTRWSPPIAQPVPGGVAAAASGREGDQRRAGGLMLVKAQGVTLAFHAVASAPAGAFEASRPLFAAILQSFHPQGTGEPGGAGAGAAISYVDWDDPKEHAFGMQVPAGWSVEGGTVRYSGIDVRQFIQVVNPARTILIEAGDPTYGYFVEPWGPYGEGKSGGLDYRRYMPGSVFGQYYVNTSVRHAMSDVRIDLARDLPQFSGVRQAAPGIYNRTDMGELHFHGHLRGKPARGMLFVTTTRLGQAGAGGTWFVGGIGALKLFFATEEELPTMAQVIQHMTATSHVNGDWVRIQQGTTAAVSRITAQTNDYISRIITEGYAARQRTYDSIFARYSRHMRDVERVRDPQSHRDYDVQAGSNYYWIDAQGRIVGTDTPYNPDPLWFDQMLRVD